MTRLRRNMNRFFYNNRNKGIPNLMLWIGIANILVFFIVQVDPSNVFYQLLRFDRAQIFHWQLWRLFTFVFTYMSEQGPIWGALSLFLYYQFGKMLEQSRGVLHFNLYYLVGIVLIDIASLLFNGIATAYFLNLSIFLAVACLAPDLTVRVFFIIPVKMKWLAWIDLGLMLVNLVQGIVSMCRNLPALNLGWLFPLLAIGNFFLFFGKESLELLPAWMHRRRYPRMKKARVKPGASRSERPYRFRCTVCGRTDADNPGLEFRYCSQCVGYRCYCSDHIGNHTHITQE